MKVLILLFLSFIFSLLAKDHKEILFGPLPLDSRSNQIFANLATSITKDKYYKCSAIIHEHEMKDWSSTNCTLITWGEKSPLNKIKERLDNSSSFPFWERMKEEFTCTKDFFDSYLEENVIESLKSMSFDMIICDGQNIPCLVTGSVLQIEKTINFSPICPPIWSSLFKRHPSYVPSIYTTLDTNMTFRERIMNALNDKANSLKDFIIKLIIGADLILKGYIRYIFRLIKTQEELYLAQCVTGFNYPEYHPPNFINIGSVSAKASQILPPEINNFLIKFDKAIYFKMENSEDQIDFNNLLSSLKIYPEFGFIFESKHYSDYILDYGHPYNVIYVPKNLSNDVLGHPKISVSVIHGDWEEILQSLYHGIPIVSVGNDFDKGTNGKLIEYREVGISLFNESKFGSEIFFKSIIKILADPIFKRNAIEISKLLKEGGENLTLKEWIDYYFENGINELIIHDYFDKGNFRLDRILIGLQPFLTFIFIVFVIYCFAKKMIERLQKLFKKNQ